PQRQTVLINGAGGCTGPLALQIAKVDGAHGTVVDRAAKLPMLEALGADELLDYERVDYLRTGKRYDFILDVVGYLEPSEYAHALTPKGEYIPIGHAHYDDNRNPILGDIPKFLGLVMKALRDP